MAGAAIRLLTAALVVLATALPSVAGPVPKFRDFPVESVYHGPVAAPDLSDPEARMFRTRLRDAAATGHVEFAGHYVIATWGCGTSCVTGALIDAISGRVHMFPFSICCDRATHDGFRRIESRPDSRLIVFAGLLNETEPMAAHFFEFRDGRFIRRATIPDDGTFR